MVFCRVDKGLGNVWRMVGCFGLNGNLLNILFGLCQLILHSLLRVVSEERFN